MFRPNPYALVGWRTNSPHPMIYIVCCFMSFKIGGGCGIWLFQNMMAFIMPKSEGTIRRIGWRKKIRSLTNRFHSSCSRNRGARCVWECWEWSNAGRISWSDVKSIHTIMLPLVVNMLEYKQQLEKARHELNCPSWSYSLSYFLS